MVVIINKHKNMSLFTCKNQTSKLDKGESSVLNYVVVWDRHTSLEYPKPQI